MNTQPLLSHMQEHHGITLSGSEMLSVLDVCKGIIENDNRSTCVVIAGNQEHLSEFLKNQENVQKFVVIDQDMDDLESIVETQTFQIEPLSVDDRAIIVRNKREDKRRKSKRRRSPIR